MSIASGLKGHKRLKVIQAHRLLEFERVFSLYLDGKATAGQVKERAKKMLECGLP